MTIHSQVRLQVLTLLAAMFLFPYGAKGQSGAELYQTWCTGCHGDNMQGSAAGSALIKSTWKYGGDRKSLRNTISKGIPGTTMVSWDASLSAKEIEALTDYILGVQESGAFRMVRKPDTVETKSYRLKIETVIGQGMTAPWAIEFVDAKRALITSNRGDVYWMVNGKLDEKKIGGLPRSYAHEMVGGLMDIALDPQYAKNGWIYLGLSYTSTGTTDRMAPGMTRIVRGKIRDYKWVEEQTLFQVHDSLQVEGGMRWGCRLMFDKDGYLFFTIGDMQQSIQSGSNPQLLHRPEGKIFRIRPDGSIPKDNPFVEKENVLRAIYANGTRNVQGLAQHPVTGEIYFTDHGPQGGDELNLLRKGANYGWPVITYGVNYDGSVITTETHREGMEQPLTYWTPSIAVCAAEFVTGKAFGKWKNQLLVTALKFEEIRRLEVKGNQVIDQEVLLKGYGRVRDVKFAPDGALYVLTNAPDALLRITIAK